MAHTLIKTQHRPKDSNERKEQNTNFKQANHFIPPNHPQNLLKTTQTAERWKKKISKIRGKTTNASKNQNKKYEELSQNETINYLTNNLLKNP